MHFSCGSLGVVVGTGADKLTCDLVTARRYITRTCRCPASEMPEKSVLLPENTLYRVAMKESNVFLPRPPWRFAVQRHQARPGMPPTLWPKMRCKFRPWPCTAPVSSAWQTARSPDIDWLAFLASSPACITGLRKKPGASEPKSDDAKPLTKAGAVTCHGAQKSSSAVAVMSFALGYDFSHLAFAPEAGISLCRTIPLRS